MGRGRGSAERNHWRSLPPFENYSCQILPLITAAKIKSCHCKVARMQLTRRHRSVAANLDFAQLQLIAAAALEW